MAERGLRARAGVTLVVLMIVVGVMATIAVVAVPELRRPEALPATTPQRTISVARRAALQSSRARTVTFVDSTGAARAVTAWPDGHLSGEPVPGLDGTSGLPPDTVKRWAIDTGSVPVSGR